MQFNFKVADMKKSITFVIGGFIAAWLYAFTSFFLLSSYMRRDVGATLWFGLQGAVFGFIYERVTWLIKRKMTLRFWHHLLVRG